MWYLQVGLWRKYQCNTPYDLFFDYHSSNEVSYSFPIAHFTSSMWPHHTIFKKRSIGDKVREAMTNLSREAISRPKFVSRRKVSARISSKCQSQLPMERYNEGTYRVHLSKRPRWVHRSAVESWWLFRLEQRVRKHGREVPTLPYQQVRRGFHFST